MHFQEIKSNIFYCGLNDFDRKYFDELIPLENGTSYNSFLIKGSEKTAILDTMYSPFTEEYVKNLEENGITNIDYIVENHGEQDHSGSIPALWKGFLKRWWLRMKKFPKIFNPCFMFLLKK